MKRILPILFAVGMILLAGCGSNRVSAYRIEEKDWEIALVQSAADGTVLAVGESWQEGFPEATQITLACTAKDGKLTLTAPQQSWEGSYARQDSSGVEAGIYTVTVGEQSGPAAVSVTTRQDGSEEPTLVMQLDGYSLYFIAGE